MSLPIRDEYKIKNGNFISTATLSMTRNSFLTNTLPLEPGDSETRKSPTPEV